MPLAAWLAGPAPDVAKDRASAVLQTVSEATSGRVKMSAMAAANAVGPCLVRKLKDAGFAVSTCSGADVAAWRSMTRVAKSYAVDAATAAGEGATLAPRCAAPARIAMTGRGRRLVVRRNASGFRALKADGGPVRRHRPRPPYGLRAGDVVRIDAPGFGRRRRIAVLSTARFDGRCVAQLRSGAKVNIMASRLALIHHTCGARSQ